MRWLIAALLLAAAGGGLRPSPAASATGTCPPGFERHALAAMPHESGDHQHVGVSLDAVDRNGNGYICGRHVGPDGTIHVHIDDRLS